MSRRILLVEDEALIAMAEARMLKKYGYDVITASNGEKAIETVDSDRGISLILMDIDLGNGIDGTEAAERILASHDLPIAFLSSHTEAEVVEKTEGITSYGYILKNSAETVLLASIRMAFRLYDAHLEVKSQKANLDSALRSYEQTAEELKEKNGELERYFTSSLDMLCIADTDGRFIRMNPEWEKVLGYSVAELEGRSFLEFVHPEDTKATWDAVAKLDAGEDVTSFENRLRHTDGSYRWIEWRSRPIASMIYAAARDVTDRKRARYEAEAREENLRTTLASIGDAVISTDTEGTITRINPVAANLCGWSSDEAHGRALNEVFHIVNADTGDRVENPVDEVLESHKTVELANHTVLISRNGTRYQIADTAAPIQNDAGQTSGVVLVFRDVTEKYRLTQMLADSERDMTRAQKMAQLGSWRIDLDSGAVFGSAQAREIYGVGQDELSLEYVQSLPLPEYRPKLDAALNALLQSGAPYDVEFQMHRRSDDTVRWIHSIAEYDVEHHRIVGTLQDITERRQTEEALRESEVHFRTVANSGQALVWTSGVNKECDYFNQPWLVFTGRSLSQELGNGWLEGVHPDDRSSCIETYLDAFDRREPFSMSYRLRRADGEYRWIQDDGTPRYDNHEEFLGYVGHCLDITELRRAEMRLQKIIDNSPLLIHEVDTSGHFLMANEATCALLGLTRKEILGRHFDELFPAETASTFKNRLEHMVEAREQMTVDDTLHIGGQDRLFRSVLFPIEHHAASLPSVIAMAYELTEEIRLAKEKDYLMKELNHRVKNSLNMVSSLVGLKEAQSDADLSDVKHQINTISLIHQKLYQTESVTEICLKGYIGSLLSSVVSFSTRNVIIEEDIDNVCIPTSQATTLGLIINEIATNAIKHGFTDTQEAILSVKLEEDQKNGHYQIRLSNTGAPFPEGIGLANPQTLGLQLISSLTEQLGGTVELQRTPHPVFTIRFPTGD